MTLKELGEFFVPLKAHLIEKAPGSKESALRLNSQRTIREAWQAFLFAIAHGTLFGCRDTLTLHIGEDKDYDAMMEWKNGGITQNLPLQLKELVGPNYNKKAKPAQEELTDLVNKLPVQYPKATDLTVAIFANYGASYLYVKIPDDLKLAGLWVFGFSNVERNQLFIAGGKSGEHRYFAPLKWS